jgi:hypothetical protein
MGTLALGRTAPLSGRTFARSRIPRRESLSLNNVWSKMKCVKSPITNQGVGHVLLGGDYAKGRERGQSRFRPGFRHSHAFGMDILGAHIIAISLID